MYDRGLALRPATELSAGAPYDRVLSLRFPDSVMGVLAARDSTYKK